MLIDELLTYLAAAGGLGGLAALIQAGQQGKKNAVDQIVGEATTTIAAQQAIASIAASQQAELNKDEQLLRSDLLTIFKAQQIQINDLQQQQQQLRVHYEQQITEQQQLQASAMASLNDRYAVLSSDHQRLLALIDHQAGRVQQVTAISLERDHWRQQASLLTDRLASLTAEIDTMRRHIQQQDIIIAGLLNDQPRPASGSGHTED